MSVGGSAPVSASQILQSVRQNTQPESDKISLKRDEVTSLENKQLAYNNIDKVMESLEDTLNALTKESTYSSRNAASSNSDLVTATASNGAAKTSFVFTEITQLAQNAMVTSASGLVLASGTAPSLTSDSDITVLDYNPNLTIENGDQSVSPAIVSGTFSINSVNISVNGSDTLYNILTKINNSGAGVTATFDADNDTVKLSGTIVGADKALTFDSGDTNFFEALNMTATTTGIDPEKDKNLDDVTEPALSGVSDGYFNINNYTFIVNTAQDSLTDLMNRVNSSNCGAVMFLDEDSGKITVTNQEEGEPLILNNDTSGFLSAIGIVDHAADTDGDLGNGESVYTGAKAIFKLNGEAMSKDSNNFTIGGVNFSLVGTTSAENPASTITVTDDHEGTVSKMEEFVNQFNSTISTLDSKLNPGEDEDETLKGDTILRRLMTSIRTTLLKSIENPGQYTSLSDIGFSFERGGGGFSLSLDTDELKEKLDEDETAVRQLFAYDSNGDGLADNGGYAVTTADFLETYTRSVSGFFYKRKDQIDVEIERLERKIYDMEEDLIDEQERQFNQMVKSVTALQQIQSQAAEINQTSAQLMSMGT